MRPRPPLTSRPSAGPRPLPRVAAEVLATALRADPVRALVSVALVVLVEASPVLTGYWVRRLLDHAGAGSAAGLAVTVGLVQTAAWWGLPLRATLRERANFLFDQRLMGLVASVPGIEHHERPDVADELELLRLESTNLPAFFDAAAYALGVVLKIGGTAVLLASVRPWLALLPLAGVPMLAVARHAERRVAGIDRELAESRRLARHLLRLATSAPGGRDIRTAGAERELLRRHAELLDRDDRQRLRAAVRETAWTLAGRLVFVAAYTVAAVVVAREAAAGRATTGDLALALVLGAQVAGQTGSGMNVVRWLVRTSRTVRRYAWFTAYVERLRHTGSLAPPPVLRRGIELRSVSLRYTGAGRDALHDVSVVLPAGAVVALVGENGAGKTSLVKLLCGFYQPTAGDVLVDGTRLADLDLPDWRGRLSGVFHDFVRFELVARQAVGVGDVERVDDVEAVTAAIHRAEAGHVVAKLPRGLDTPLGRSFDQDGTDLSAGQWQQLAVARGLMRRPLLRVLDEPTTSLDPAAEEALYARLARLAGAEDGVTTLLVTHRLPTVRMADLVLLLDGGRLVEHGSHEALLRAGGRYAELWRLQAARYGANGTGRARRDRRT